MAPGEANVLPAYLTANFSWSTDPVLQELLNGNCEPDVHMF